MVFDDKAETTFWILRSHENHKSLDIYNIWFGLLAWPRSNKRTVIMYIYVFSCVYIASDYNFDNIFDDTTTFTVVWMLYCLFNVLLKYSSLKKIKANRLRGPKLNALRFNTEYVENSKYSGACIGKSKFVFKIKVLVFYT